MDYPGEKLLIRLWETLAEKGIGSILRPWQIRREGRALIDVRREEILVLAQAERDAEDIRTGRKSVDAIARVVQALPEHRPAVEVRELSAPYEMPQAAARKASESMVADAVRKEVNVAKAILAAESEVEGDGQEPPERQVDEDWLFRWREAAGGVSVDYMQNLWGKVLAGEIKSPGAFSLRTMEFLKNLSQGEAADIAKLSRFAVINFVFRGNKAILEAAGVTYGFLLRMQDVGILSGVEAVGMRLTLVSQKKESFETGLTSNGRVLLVTNEDPAKTASLETYALTAVGREVMKLGTFEPHEEYLRSVGQAIKDQGFTVRLAHFQRTSETGGQYSHAVEL